VTLTHSTLSARAGLTARILLAGCAGILVAACAAPRPAPPPEAPDPEVREISPEARAGNLLIEAEATPDPAPARTAIDAVLGLEEPAGDAVLRANWLWTLLPDDGRGTLADRYRGARLAVLLGDSGLALERLPPIDESPDTALYRDALALHAELLTTHGPALEALLARVELDPYRIDRPELQSANQRAIWRLLAALDSAQIRQLDRLEDPEPIAGWIELFRAVRGAGTDPDAFTEAVAHWEREHPRHPGQALLPELRDTLQQAIEPPARVAVLLPLSGPLADLGNALLEGIAARFYQSRDMAGSLLVFDTAGQEDLADAAYRNALQQGADRVIGPLVPEAVDRVATIDSGVPTLLLNHPPGTLAAPFWVLSLSPEDDARAVAERARGLGNDRALVLVPEGSFGDRVAGAFRDALERQSGRVTAEHRFEARSPEINTRIGTALGIDASEQRIQRVRRQTRLELEADAQVRGDIDMIFIAGPAADLRLVVPHLHYHRASRLPILATSHVYEGRPQADRDRDLSGIRFPDAPWLHPALNPEPELLAELASTEEIETTASRLPRFAALGIDAMDVASGLSLYLRAPHLEVNGVAGTWRQHPPTRNWLRQPAWLEFHDGLARPAPMQVIEQRED